ncbi:prepilin-type N-terminal cleavage/methylation domain-containing protein [Candidatus Falkowbacteria bacterium]|jgi:prepilin-type N-terminal cleavage/methylation domain-containing protein|nr:prepilin-type N-terminal cleavage/methylation domain-containing protein [Candidatus Falkowbacteria bacterium]MBT4432974.1 prepilin-type N-terminal cleavage/methylation domain-containing protein [Candidatus Falkowbacteria bacterium]
MILPTTNYQLSTTKGFTLLEILLVVAIIVIIAGFSMPVLQSFQNRNDLDIATNIFVQSLRRSQVLSRSAEEDSSWGTYIQAGNITIFQGSTYAGRDSDFDEVFEISSSINLSGDQEIIFGKVTGTISSSKSTILTSLNNDSRTIDINVKGMISY